MSRVIPALRPRGDRNPGTAVATVCTPASATEPEENARSTMNTAVSPMRAVSSSSTGSTAYPLVAATGVSPVATR